MALKKNSRYLSKVAVRIDEESQSWNTTVLLEFWHFLHQHNSMQLQQDVILEIVGNISLASLSYFETVYLHELWKEMCEVWAKRGHESILAVLTTEYRYIWFWTKYHKKYIKTFRYSWNLLVLTLWVGEKMYPLLPNPSP